jgi:hypothetical protein
VIDNVQDVELLPGFIVHEHKPGLSTVTVPSEFKLRIARLGPYVFSPLDTREDLKDPGPFTVIIKLMEKLQPPGIEVPWVYEAPDEMPNREQFPKEWAWWHQNLAYGRKRLDILALREKARVDMMLLAAVRIVDGPYGVDDPEWLRALAGMVGEPQTHADRLLLFFYTQVLTTTATFEVVKYLATTKEVTIEGIKSAFDRFRSVVE